MSVITPLRGRLFTTREAAEFLGMPMRRIRRLVEAKKILANVERILKEAPGNLDPYTSAHLQKVQTQITKALNGSRIDATVEQCLDAVMAGTAQRLGHEISLFRIRIGNADELDAGHEHGQQLERLLVDHPVPVGDVFEDLLIARLPPLETSPATLTQRGVFGTGRWLSSSRTSEYQFSTSAEPMPKDLRQGSEISLSLEFISR